MIQFDAAVNCAEPLGQFIPPLCATWPDGFCRNRLAPGLPETDRFTANVRAAFTSFAGKSRGSPGVGKNTVLE